MPPAPHPRATLPQCQAFTLYEVLMAAMVLAMGLLGSLAIFPKALETQKLARQKLLAASVAYDVVTRHATGFDHTMRDGRHDYNLGKAVNNPNLLRLGFRSSGQIDFIGKGDGRAHSHSFSMYKGQGGTWNNHVEAIGQTMASTDPDYMMTRQATHRDRLFGPVPPAILERLDSEHDEIGRLAEEGIGVYYLWPYAVNSDAIDGENVAVSDEAAHPLLFAAVGYPQIDASFHSPSQFHSFAMIDEPDGYPSPGAYLYRNKARFLYEDPDTGVPTPGEPRWRCGYWEAWRWKYYNSYQRYLAHQDGVADMAPPAGTNWYNDPANNAAFVFPFKYHLWDYEVQVVDPYFEWEKVGYFRHDQWSGRSREYRSWEDTPHATAIETLEGEDATKAECLKCHTTGFGEPTGFTSMEETEHLVPCNT